MINIQNFEFQISIKELYFLSIYSYRKLAKITKIKLILPTKALKLNENSFNNQTLCLYFN